MKVYDINLQRYTDKKIRVSGKDSVPLHENQYLLVRTYNGHFYKHFCPWDTR